MNKRQSKKSTTLTHKDKKVIASFSCAIPENYDKNWNRIVESIPTEKKGN